LVTTSEIASPSRAAIATRSSALAVVDELVAGHREGHHRRVGVGQLGLLDQQDVRRGRSSHFSTASWRALSELTFQVAMRTSDSP
jgi:hypothetical protein